MVRGVAQPRQFVIVDRLAASSRVAGARRIAELRQHRVRHEQPIVTLADQAGEAAPAIGHRMCDDAGAHLTPASRSSRLPVAALKGHEPRLHRVQNHQLHDGTVLGVADIHIPILRHLTGNGLVTQADFKNVVLRIIVFMMPQIRKLRSHPFG